MIDNSLPRPFKIPRRRSFLILRKISNISPLQGVWDLVKGYSKEDALFQSKSKKVIAYMGEPVIREVL